jgi:predicted deacetylase
MPAAYLIRFDDICPTMNWQIWGEIEALLLEKNVKPILAVIPENLDPALMVDDPVPDFWERVRRWQSLGWTIALHGYQHKYVNSRKGLMGISPYSEFTGLPREDQEDRLRRGMEVFRQQGIHTEVFVAPAHSFDRTTLSLLPKYGLKVVSDGLSRLPYSTKDGLFWIPQQIWKFSWKCSGVWTVCFHHNIWGKQEMEDFRRSLDRFQGQLTSVQEVTTLYANRPLDWADWLFSWYYYVWRVVIRGQCSRLLRTFLPCKTCK